MPYKRILLKLSGEALMGNRTHGIDPKRIKSYSKEISELVKTGVEIAIVIGGGNIFRGLSAASNGMDRVQADYMGMLATVMNGLALQSTLEDLDVQTRLQTALKMESIAEPYIKRKAVRHLEKKRVVIFSAGTGNPFFTTDTAAALRAMEINADIMIKATKVDGIFSDDPEKNPKAKMFSQVTFDEVINKDLKVMDATAFTLCRDQKLPIAVFNIFKENTLKNILLGKKEGTLVSMN